MKKSTKYILLLALIAAGCSSSVKPNIDKKDETKIGTIETNFTETIEIIENIEITEITEIKENNEITEITEINEITEISEITEIGEITEINEIIEITARIYCDEFMSGSHLL